MKNKKTVRVIITEELYEAANKKANGAFIKLALDVFNLDLNKIDIVIEDTCYYYTNVRNVGSEIDISLDIINGHYVISVSNINEQYPSNINKGVKDASR